MAHNNHIVGHKVDTASLSGKVWFTSATVGADGRATVSPPAGYFSSVHFAAASVERNTSDPTVFGAAFVISKSPSSVVVQGFQGRNLAILGDTLEELDSGVTVNIVVMGL